MLIQVSCELVHFLLTHIYCIGWRVFPLIFPHQWSLHLFLNEILVDICGLGDLKLNYFLDHYQWIIAKSLVNSVCDQKFCQFACNFRTNSTLYYFLLSSSLCLLSGRVALRISLLLVELSWYC